MAEFLQKKGMALEDASPNAKITDEQYEELKTAFGKDKDIHAETKLDIQKRKEKERKEKEERKEQERKEQEQKKQEIYRVNTEKKVQLKVVGSINEEKPKQEEKPKKEEKPAPAPKKEEPKVEAVQKPEPVAEKKVEQQAEPVVEAAKPVEEKPAAVAEQPKATEEKKEEGVFRASTPDAGIQFKQVGFIDLSSLNSKTRPDKKSKAERKKEREEKDRQRQEMKNKVAANGNTAGGDADGKKKKRQRIGKERVDVNAAANQIQQKPGQQGGKNNNNNQQKNGQQGGKNNQPKGQGFEGGKKNKKFTPQPKQELSDEEVAKQVKETLARLTSKQMKKGVKYRKDKRDAIHSRMQEMENEENAESKVPKLTEFVTANELASMMNVSVTQVIGTCMSIGMMVSINQRLDAETINIVAEEFGYTTSYVSEEVSNAIIEEEDAEEDLESRAPIITVMGHVDHGKTSLLDNIRKTNVIEGEAGGITQHIGAYSVELNGEKITFLDTPGHEAFTAMRARGAKMTDVAIIIVAADDSVMPQTVEAINHASAAGVPMVFAINKMDKPQANSDRIREQLSAMNYLVEDWGGKYQCQEVSAKKGMNLDKLLEKVLLEAEMLELKANPDRKASGAVIESMLDKGRGYVATIMVQNGTLRVGDVLLSGTYTGRVKAMFDENGKKVTEAGPSTPVQVLGLNGAPQAGDTFNVMDDDRSAREIANKREQLQRMQGIMTQKHVTLDEIGRRIAIGSFKELNIIVKGDVDGSVEAMSGSLIKLSKETVQVNVIHSAVGQISESDVLLAAASNAIIVGFQVRPSAAARKAAEKEQIDIRLYSIIYDAINEIKDAIEGMLEPVMKEEIVCSTEVLETFKISKVGTVAGCVVREGRMQRNTPIRVIRDGIVIYTGKLGSLRRFKDDVKEVTVGQDCGLNIESYNDIKVGDIIEGYEQVEVKRK